MRDYQPFILICTLGGQPQVVTFALDYLLRQGVPIQEVVALYVATPDGRVGRSLEKLRAEFDGEQYRGQPCRFRQVPIRRGGERLAEIRTEADAEATRQTAHQLITDLKREARLLQLCIAGGPRMMAMMILNVVTMHCGHQDKVWHMYTAADFLAQAKGGAIMHDEAGDQVHLIPVPLVPWGTYFPALRSLYETPTEILQAQTTWLDETERGRCEQVQAALSPRQREVLRLLAQGHAPQVVAEQLAISIKTLDSHKTVILAECRIAWELLDNRWLDYHFLREQFGAFFEMGN